MWPMVSAKRLISSFTGSSISFLRARSVLASTDLARKKLIDEPVKELISRFAETMGHTDCLTIIGYNVNIPEQRELPACKGIMKEKCKLAIATAVQIVDEILAAKAAE